MFERSAKKNFVSDPCMRADWKILSAAAEKQSRKYIDIYLYFILTKNQVESTD